MDRFEKVKTNEPATEGLTEEGDFYVCRYRIEGLPKNKSLTIKAEFLDLRLWDTEPWISHLIEGGRPQPPASHHRIFNVNHGVILTDEQSNATADFRVAYAWHPSPSDPR
jgi:hypothetical protein